MAGLGNPGPEYAGTRHNIGFMVLDLTAKRLGASPWARTGSADTASARLGQHELKLVKPQTFMNRSGLAIARLASEAEISEGRIIVVHDDLEFPGRLSVLYVEADTSERPLDDSGVCRFGEPVPISDHERPVG